MKMTIISTRYHQCHQELFPCCQCRWSISNGSNRGSSSRTREWRLLWCYLDKVPAINTSYKNNAKMTATEIKGANKVADIQYPIHWWRLHGEKYSFTIHKKGENRFERSYRCCLCCDSRWYWWASGNHYDRWEWCWHHLRAWSNEAYSQFKEIQGSNRYMFSQRTYPRSAKGRFWKWPHCISQW